MAKATLTQSQLQLASTLVKQSAAAREARRKASPLNRADLAGDPHLRDEWRESGHPGACQTDADGPI